MIFVAPVLPLDVRMMMEGVEAAGLLNRLVSRWVWSPGEVRLLERSRVLGSLVRRGISPVSSARLERVLLADLQGWLARKFGSNSIHSTDLSFAQVDARAAKLVGRDSRVVVGREDACVQSFRRARELGVSTVYQLPTAHFATVEKLVRADMEGFPEGYDEAVVAQDFETGRLKRKAGELALADWVLCPSQFVRRSVEAAGVPTDRIHTLPLGMDSSWAPDIEGSRDNVFLYVGNITARKGVHRLLRAWKRLGAYRTHTLRLIGDMHLPQTFLDNHKGVYEHIGRVQRSRLIQHYTSVQAFVFNAMADGFGHVFGEAMLCGTPVLASRNCGAPDFITDGDEGWLFNYGDEEALCTALEQALSQPDRLREMGRRARARALAWGQEQFVNAWVTWIREVIQKGAPGSWEVVS